MNIEQIITNYPDIIFLTSSLQLEDCLNLEEIKQYNGHFTIYTWSKYKGTYNKTSIQNLPMNSPRFKNFVAHYGLSHYVHSIRINNDTNSILVLISKEQ